MLLSVPHYPSHRMDDTDRCLLAGVRHETALNESKKHTHETKRMPRRKSKPQDAIVEKSADIRSHA